MDIKMLIGMDWKPKSVGVDFEKALINAVRDSFSDSVIIGCFFHMKQAIYRKIVKLGLKNEDSNWFTILKGITALCIENPISLEESIASLEEAAGSEWINFFLYFKSTWCKRFGPELWNVEHIKKCLNENLVCRTNNALERYNRKLNENLQPHANIIALLDFFKI